MNNIWSIIYSREGDFLVLYEVPTWALFLEDIAAPLLNFGFTYRLANWTLGFTDKQHKKVHCEPLNEEMTEKFPPFWREDGDGDR